MAKTHSSPSSAQRLRVIETYRGLARRNTNLFLIYSIKMDRDWLISGDRRFIHWIYYLETDPEVKAFDFRSEFDRGNERFWIVDVILAEGTRITHQVSGNAGEYDEATERKKHSSADSSSRQESRAFYDEDLRPVVKVSLRWLKPIGFAAALRNQEYCVA